jgi:hypothetical protein
MHKNGIKPEKINVLWADSNQDINFTKTKGQKLKKFRKNIGKL